MTLPLNSNRLNDAVELQIAHGFDEIGKSLRILLDTAMLIRGSSTNHVLLTKAQRGHLKPEGQ